MTSPSKARVKIIVDADKIKFVSFYRNDLTKMGVSVQDDLALGLRWRKILIGIASGESGHDPLADRALREALERMAHGRKGAEGRWRRDNSPDQSPCPSNARAMPIERETETEKREILKPKPKKEPDSVSDSVERSSLESEQPEAGKEEAWSAPNPWEFAARFCGQGGDKFTRNTFAKRCGEVGDQAFREELHAFMAEIEAGESVANRGKAFTARLTKLRDQVKVKATIRESLRMAK